MRKGLTVEEQVESTIRPLLMRKLGLKSTKFPTIVGKFHPRYSPVIPARSIT